MDRLRRPLTLCLLACALCAGGCSVRVATHGQSDVEATYFAHTLWADIDRTIRPADVHAAARRSVRQFGLTVFKDRVTGTETELAASGPGDVWPKRVVVETRDTGTSTHVWLTMRPSASEAYLRTLFDAILREIEGG